MAGKNLLNKQLIDKMSQKMAESSVTKSIKEEGQKAVVEQVIKMAVVGVAALPVLVAKSRRSSRQRSEAVYRILHKLRVIGEDALALENESLNEERQRVVADAAALRDTLHEQLLDLHVSATAGKSGALDLIEPAVKDADRLMAALNRWALSSADTRGSSALLEAVEALAASEKDLRSHLGKSRRKRTRQEVT